MHIDNEPARTAPTPEEVAGAVEKLNEEMRNMTPAALGEHIRDLILAGRKSRRHRAEFRKGDLRALCAWERELTENYGIVRKGAQ